MRGVSLPGSWRTNVVPVVLRWSPFGNLLQPAMLLHKDMTTFEDYDIYTVRSHVSVTVGSLVSVTVGSLVSVTVGSLVSVTVGSLAHEDMM